MIAAKTLDLLARAADAARSDLQTGAVYRQIETALQELVGYRLLTILQVRGGRLYRMHTSDLATYPAGGYKNIHQDPWLQSMLGEGKPVISPDAQTVRQRFFDHALIESLGCGAVLNLPVTCAAGTLGSLNLLHKEHWFTPDNVQLAGLFASHLAVAWLGQQLSADRTWPPGRG